MPELESIEGKSSGDLKEMLMQTKAVEPDEEVKAEAEEELQVGETEKEEETKSQDTEEESETEEKVESEKQSKTYKLKRGKQEVEVDEKKVVSLAQQGIDYNIKMHQLKEWEQELKQKAAQTAATNFANVPWDKVNPGLTAQLQENPGMTLSTMMATIFDEKMRTEQEQRKAERAYQTKLSDTFKDLWPLMKPKYQEYRDDGYDPHVAASLAQKDVALELATQDAQTALKRGAKKALRKQAADIATGEKKTARGPTEIPSVEEASKMKSSADIAKFLRRTQVPGW